MRLILAPGCRDMQDALADGHVKRVVDLLLQLFVMDKALFDLAASFLRKNEQGSSSQFSQDLQALEDNGKISADISSAFIDEFVQALIALYAAPLRVVGFRRGAIVELLTYALVSRRCRPDECKSNHRFLYPSRPFPHNSSDQVDVAVLAKSKMQIEGYSCKMQGNYMQSVDCTNLHELSLNGDEDGYFVHVGVVSFDSSKTIWKRLRYLSSPAQNFIFEDTIQPYGLDNLTSLTQSPFL